MTVWRTKEYLNPPTPSIFGEVFGPAMIERVEWEAEHPPAGGYITAENGERVYYFSKRPVDIVREYAPGVTDEEAGAILWEFTGWPCFWMGDPETCMREQLAKPREEIANDGTD